MSPDLQEISARLLALETVLGHLVSHLAVRDDDPYRWLATRKVLAMHAANNVERDTGCDDLARAMSEAIAAFFEDVERAICRLPDGARAPQKANPPSHQAFRSQSLPVAGGVMFKQLMLAAVLAAGAPACARAASQQAAPNQAPAPPFSITPETPKSNGSARLGHDDAGKSLAQRLNESNGTIHPPPVDPEMNKVPPQTGTMPIVKPPPNVQSK